MSKTTKKFKKFKSMHDLYQRCDSGDEQAQRICIGALQNLGCDHLAEPSKRCAPDRPKWYWFYRGMEQYIEALICEYGVHEDKAFREVLAEVNNVWDCCDDVKLS